MPLPGEQNCLIPLLAEANPNTVVAITAGSPVAMPWIDKVKAATRSMLPQLPMTSVLQRIFIYEQIKRS